MITAVSAPAGSPARPGPDVGFLIELTGGDDPAARAAVRAALATLTRAGDAAAPDLRRARAWLATLPAR